MSGDWRSYQPGSLGPADPAPVEEPDDFQSPRQRPPLARRMLAGALRRLLLLPVLLVATMLVLVLGTTHRPPLVGWGGGDASQAPVTPASLGLFYRDVTIRTDDGVDLAAWHVPVWSASQFLRYHDQPLRDRHPGLVLCHGPWADRRQLLYLAPALHAAGYELLLLDLRGCGASEGHVSFSLQEWRDVQAAVTWLQQAGPVDPQRIGLVAIESSSVAALRAASGNPSIRAVAADRPCRRLGTMFRGRFDSLSLPGEVLGRLYEWTFALMNAADLSDASADHWAGQLAPAQGLLVTARRDDPLVPAADPGQVLDPAPGPRRLWTNPFPGDTPTQPAIVPAELVRFLGELLAPGRSSAPQPPSAAGV